MVAAFFPRYFRVLILSLLIWSLSSSLEFPRRLHKSRWSWLDRHLSGSRNLTLSNQCLSTFFCTTTYYEAFPNAFFSSDALLLVNRALSPPQKLKFWPLTYIYIYIYIYNFMELFFTGVWQPWPRGGPCVQTQFFRCFLFTQI